jgi:hypothetical protein
MRVAAGTIGLVTVMGWVGGCALMPSTGGGSERTATTSSAERDDDRRCDDDHSGDCRRVEATVIATGIPGAGPVAAVGLFHRGDAVHDKPVYNVFLAPGQVLDGTRVLVGSTSNYGAPLGDAAGNPGTVLSIDPNQGQLAVPANFANAGGQASALAGAVQVYSSNNAAFLNSIKNPGSATPTLAGAELPLGISINNGNGRPWVANAPTGSNGQGTISVLDPQGYGLAGAPDPVAGGEFAGNETNRNAASTHGLVSGALGTAIFSKSSDGSTKAVFAAAEADGSIVQVHVLKGVDGLVPPGTLSVNPNVSPSSEESTDPHTVSRIGLAFNWVPNRVLYAADGIANQVVAFDISDNGTLFIASAPRYLDGDGAFDVPVDVQPTMSEVASENFASNSTLGAGSDLYVLNRGNNSIVRITQDGHVRGKRTVTVDGMDKDDFRLNGLGVSPDGQTIWVSAVTSGGGMLLSVPAFGSGPIMPDLVADAVSGGAKTVSDFGTHFVSHAFTPQEGVGPLFNATSCAGCHSDPSAGGMGDTIFDTTVGEIEGGQFFQLENNRGPTERAHAISELGSECDATAPDLPHDANAFSQRSTMTLRGTSLIDFIQKSDILAAQAAEPASIQGHPNFLADGRIGKFGWKANVATLVEFMGDAFRNEMGLTNNISPVDETDECGANDIKPEIDALPLESVNVFLQTIDNPAPTASCLASPGATVFQTAGCAGCHKPSLPGPGFSAFLFSDLLVHDMGAGLADGFVQGSASGSEWRTMQLSGLSQRTHFIHDGRASTVTQAIQVHGGQASASVAAFNGLSASDQAALLSFLGCI